MSTLLPAMGCQKHLPTLRCQHDFSGHSHLHQLPQSRQSLRSRARASSSENEASIPLHNISLSRRAVQLGLAASSLAWHAR